MTDLLVILIVFQIDEQSNRRFQKSTIIQFFLFFFFFKKENMQFKIPNIYLVNFPHHTLEISLELYFTFAKPFQTKILINAMEV